VRELAMQGLRNLEFDREIGLGSATLVPLFSGG